MQADIKIYIKNLIKNKLNSDITCIKNNLFLIENKNGIELISLWYRSGGVGFFGFNNKYLENTQNTIIIKEECGEDRVYIVPSNFLQSLDMYQDDSCCRSVTNIKNDTIYLLNKKRVDISKYRVA